MPLLSKALAAALGLAACLACAGCGGDSALPAASQAATPDLGDSLSNTAAPQRLKLPASLRSLEAANREESSGDSPQSIAIRYEKAEGNSATSRITELSATPDAAISGMIHEPAVRPLAANARSPAADISVALAPRRSQFVPLELSTPAPGIAESPFPALPAQPTFNAPRQTAEAAPNPAPAKRAEGWQMRRPSNEDALSPVTEQARQISDRGFAMGRRGMPYAACAELVKSLQLVAQALDVQHGNSTHSAALASGLAALEEARDFVSSSGEPVVVNVAEKVAMHRTPVLKEHPSTESLSPVVGQQQYFAFAQAQLAIAAGGQPVSSQSLYRLGKLQTALAVHDADPQSLHAPQAMVFYQAALSADRANYLAANELGVLLARYGQLQEARSVLLHSVSVRPQLESWHNLAAVHRRLGEEDLSRRAEHERDLIAQKTGRTAGRSSDLLRWVDPQTFAKSGVNDTNWPANTAAAGVARSADLRR